MNINGINDNMNNSTITNTKNKVADESFEKRLQGAMEQKDEKELKKACQDFEGIMLNMMYKEMKNTIPKSELLEEDQGKAIYESMLDDQLIENASNSNRFGLAEVLYKQLSKRL